MNTPEERRERTESLLLHCWSFEHLLRLEKSEDTTDTDFLYWAQRKAYYSALNSTRAMLLTERINATSDEDVNREVMTLLASFGKYPQNPIFGNFRFTFLDRLHPYKNASAQHKPRPQRQPLDSSPSDSPQQALIAEVSLINGHHEFLIAQRIGVESYKAILDSMPDYLGKSFPAERFEKMIWGNSTI